jgi:hypothetical protein
VLDMPELTNELQDGLRRWWRETGAFIPTEPNPTYSPQR